MAYELSYENDEMVAITCERTSHDAYISSCAPERFVDRTDECGDLTIHTAERIATLRSHELHLTSEEFDVLLFLVTHPRGIVTQRTMLTTAWSVGKLRHTEFLRSLVSLRNKLNAMGTERPHLRTEVWVMYRLDSNSSGSP